MRQNVIIGIDAGSTHLKIGFHDLSGQLLEIRHHKIQVLHSLPEFSEFDAEDIFNHLSHILKEVMETSNYDPVAIGISSFGESIVLISKKGKVLDPMIAWYDMRGENDILRFAAEYGIKELYKKTGQYASGKFTLAKLLWLKEKKPFLLSETHAILFMQDYIAYGLTGNLCTDYSLASRSMLFDLNKKTWAPDILSSCGLTTELLPKVIPSGECAGYLSSYAAKLTGLPEGIPIILAGHDHASASISADIQDNFIALDSLGTSETCITAGISNNHEKLYNSNIAFYPYYQENYRFLCSIQGCGASIEWMAKMFFHENMFSSFFNSASAMESYAMECPIILPFFKGIQEKPGLFASVKGLKDAHTKEHLCYSLLEGLSMEYRRRLEQVETATEVFHPKIRAVGRLSSNPFFMQLKANILQRPVEVIDINEAVVLGAAILAGKNTGIIKKWEPLISCTYVPEKDKSEILEIRYQQYLNEVSYNLMDSYLRMPNKNN